MNLLMAAAATMALALGGVGVLRILWPPICQTPPMACLALGFCVGCFLETVVLFMAFVVGASFSRLLALAPIIGFGILGAVTMVRSRWSLPRFDLAGFLAVLLVLLALALSWGRPIYGYDALSMWALKAKVAFFAKTWPSTLLDPHTSSHPDYPPLVPSAQAFVFFWLNRFDDVASRIIFAAFFASGAAILWWWLGVLRISTRGLWLLWWCAVPVMMDQVKITYADLPLAVFLVVFYGAVVSWLRDLQRRRWLWLATIYGGIAFWVKQDALVGIGGGFLALLLVARRRRLPLPPVFVSIGVTVMMAVPWRVLLWGRQYGTDFGFPSAHWGPRAALVAKESLHYAFFEGNYAFFWPLLVLVLVLCARRLSKAENLWLALTIAIEAAMVLALYLFAVVDLEALLKTSVERVLMNLFVPALLLIALLWRGSFAILRRKAWQRWAAGGAVLLIAWMFWIGLHRRSDQELVGFAVSPFPLAISWLWAIVAAVTMAKFYPGLKHGRLVLAWRATQFAIVAATIGLTLISIGVFAREAGEIRRRFGGRTLEEQHAVGLDPVVRQRLALARKEFSVGTHVRLVSKRALYYHEFYYAAYPDLIADGAASQEVDLATAP